MTSKTKICETVTTIKVVKIKVGNEEFYGAKKTCKNQFKQQRDFNVWSCIWMML